MINYRFIARAIGLLMVLEALLMGSCWLVGLGYGERDWQQWALPMGVSAGLGMLLVALSRGAQGRFGRRDGYLVVSLVWIIFSAMGMLPFLVGGHTDRVALAFCETMSGFTTTGATAFFDIDALPHSILFWRSLMHWVGGMGIIFFTMAFLPVLGLGEQQLFSAESTGIPTSKLHPRISTTAHWLWGVYFLLTGLCILTYWGFGMNFFDAVTQAWGTISTGGFATHTASMAYFKSPAIEYAAVLFMMLGACNFTLLYLLIIKRQLRQVVRDEELRLFFALYAGAVLLITLSKWVELGELSESSFRATLFQTMSLMSSTGFTTTDFMQWPHLAWITLTLVSIIGSCSGSTAGGVKVVRILTTYKIVRNEFHKMLHPRAVLPMKLNRDLLDTGVTQSIFAYTSFYILFIVTGSAAMAMMKLPMLDAVGLSISAFSNIGPAIGYHVGALGSWGVLPDGALWVNSLLMLAGRLEIFTLLLPFVPAFWRNH